MKTFVLSLEKILEPMAKELQHLLLLALRLYFGWGFFLAGKGKFLNFDKTVGFFESLGIPFAELNVVMAAGTEVLAGLLLLLGLGARIASLPLIFTMLVAYLTAHSAELFGIFSAPDKFIKAAPFLFLLSSLLVFAFGPGKYSVDQLRKAKQ